MFLKGLVAVGLGLALLAGPASAQESQATQGSAKPKTAREAKNIEQQREAVEGMDFDFVDSREAYWVTRSLNDTLYNAGYSPNAVNYEHDQDRARQLAKLSGMYKAPEVVEVRVKDKPVGPLPVLRINGKVVQP